MALKLISLNIEGRNHLDLVIPFLQTAAPDVVCLMELYEMDLERFRSALGAEIFFVPMNTREHGVFGVGILSKFPLTQTEAARYGGAHELQEFDNRNAEAAHATTRFSLISAEVEKEGELFRICTTHFPVTKEAQATDFQREDMRALLALLKEKEEFVVCGDFNAPRGDEIFGMLTQHYRDNVPARYTSSIDGRLHRAGPLPYMVDGFFTTPRYTASVEMVCGVSDHCALVGEVSANTAPAPVQEG